MTRTQTTFAILTAFAAGAFFAGQPAKASLGVKCVAPTKGGLVTAGGIEKRIAEVTAGGRETVAMHASGVICAW